MTFAFGAYGYRAPCLYPSRSNSITLVLESAPGGIDGSGLGMANRQGRSLLEFLAVSKFTSASRLSSAYMVQASASCFWLLRHEAVIAFCFAFDNAGKSRAARIAMMAMTTNNSMRVKAQIPIFPVGILRDKLPLNVVGLVMDFAFTCGDQSACCLKFVFIMLSNTRYREQMAKRCCCRLTE